jgi:hypothetical protein
MHLPIMNMVRPLCGLVAGGLIGVSFGMVQDAAGRRYKKLEQSGALNTAWAVMPGSFRRVAYFLVALALIQLLCPLLFTDGCQWWVSGGVVAGYGAILFGQLRQRLSQTNK